MKKQIVLFDIDQTMLDDRRLFEEFFLPNLIKKCGFTEGQIRQATREYKKTLEKNTDFNPEELTNLLIKIKNIDPQIILNIFYQPEFFAQALFPETKPILTELQKNFVLGIFSEGIEFWQRKKLDSMGIKDYFEQNLVFIERRKTAVTVLASLPERAMIVDDSKNVIEELLKFGKIKPIWINRLNKPVIEGVEQIKSLVELPVLLQKINLNLE